MGEAKIKQRAAFAPQLIESWEADGCVNFAIALARLTGWLLHVDWWAPSSREDIPPDQLKPLRVYRIQQPGIEDVGIPNSQEA